MVWVRSPVYFYKRNDTFYFSRAIPSDLLHRFNKRKIEVSLRTKSEAKAAKSAAALSDRLERYWDSLRMEMIYSRELGLRVAPEAKTTISAKSFSMTAALALYHRLKGGGKTKLFFESSERSMRYLIDCLGHDDLAALEISDAGRFRDHLFDRGMSSSSVKRVFSSVRAVINLAIREQGLSINNVFSGTFIPDDETKTQRLPIPTDVLLTIQHECMQLDDEPRWLIALISDTGMRLSEACGVLTSDICLDGVIPLTFEIDADRSGTIEEIDIQTIAALARAAGAPLDKSAGVYLCANVASTVEKGQTLLRIHASSQKALEEAVAKVNEMSSIVRKWSEASC